MSLWQELELQNMKGSWYTTGARWKEKNRRQEEFSLELNLLYESAQTNHKCMQYYIFFSG